MDKSRPDGPAQCGAPEHIRALRARFEEALRRGAAGPLGEWLAKCDEWREEALSLSWRWRSWSTGVAPDCRRPPSSTSRGMPPFGRTSLPQPVSAPPSAAPVFAPARPPAPNPSEHSQPDPPSVRAANDPSPMTEVVSEDAKAAAKARSAGAERPPAPEVPGYEILGTLGRGGMGVVYKARHLKLGRDVALKMVLAGAHAGERQWARFRIEAEAVARLQHPHIVQIYEVGERGGSRFFRWNLWRAAAWPAGSTARHWPFGPAADLVRLLAQAMHYAHQRGVLHRDIKPANVLLTPAEVPKISDFGLAKHLDENDGVSRSGEIMGTPSYMAPEQADGRNRDLGPWTDVYALGAILYELLAGRPPFKGASVLETLDQVRRRDPTPPRQLRPKTPLDLETICLKCLRKDTAGRYQAAGDLAADLQRFLHGEPVHARPVGVVERGCKSARRRPAAAALAVGVVAAVAAAAAAVPWHIATLHAEVNASNVEVNRLRDREQEEREGRRRADACADAQHWLSEGQEVLGRRAPNDLEDARLLFAKASDRIDAAAAAEPALQDLKEEAGRRLADVERRRGERAAAAKADAAYRQFFALRDEAFFQLYRDAFAGPDPASPAASREAARKALALMGLDQDRPGVPDLGVYDPARRERLTAGLYEVLLLLAEATARPLPGLPDEERRRQCPRGARPAGQGGRTGARFAGGLAPAGPLLGTAGRRRCGGEGARQGRRSRAGHGA